MHNINHLVYRYLKELGATDALAKNLNMLALALFLIVIIFIVDFAVRKGLRTIITLLARRSKTKFDDLLVINKTPRNIAHIVPLAIAIEFLPVVFADFPITEAFFERGLKMFAIVLTLWVIRSILNTLKDYFKTLPRLKDKPIDSYIQVFMIFSWTIGVFSAIALITRIPFLNFLTGLGAASAIILLVFRDTILGFVASIQVSVNDMVRIGDWITFEKYGADGDVIEINLATVKVQNFDKTITTIPTYALISDSFKNWRGMRNSGGRRIKRALFIKQSSIKYLSEGDVNAFSNIQLIAPYLENRQRDINNFNRQNNINKN